LADMGIPESTVTASASKELSGASDIRHAFVCTFRLGIESGVFKSSVYFVIFILGNFRLTAATTEPCSGFPELLAKASRA
jgi:hypothetical protein